MKKRSLKKRLICKLIIATLVFNQIIAAPVAYALETVQTATPPKSPTEIMDLVVLIVDKKITEDGSDHSGLRNDYLSSLNEADLEGRIARYAEDIINNNEATDVQIIYFDEERDTAVDIASALENLYLSLIHI